MRTLTMTPDELGRALRWGQPDHPLLKIHDCLKVSFTFHPQWTGNTTGFIFATFSWKLLFFLKCDISLNIDQFLWTCNQNHSGVTYCIIILINHL